MKRWMAGALLFSGAASAAFAQSKGCARACMIALTDRYLAALVKHDPTGLPPARGVRFTENTAARCTTSRSKASPELTWCT